MTGMLRSRSNQCMIPKMQQVTEWGPRCNILLGFRPRLRDLADESFQQRGRRGTRAREAARGACWFGNDDNAMIGRTIREAARSSRADKLCFAWWRAVEDVFDFGDLSVPKTWVRWC